MRQQKQLIRHDPENGQWGDCFRTAIACLLDLPADQVPHFFDGGGTDVGGLRDLEEIHREIEEWLNGMGFALLQVLFPGGVEGGLDAVLTTMKNLNPGLYYMLSGKSLIGSDHVVICCDDAIVWDPSQVNSGIVGPDSVGYYRIEILVPVMLKKGAEPSPEGPWKCFHCWEVFHHPTQAAMHFGATPGAEPLCKVQKKDWPLAYAYRDLEAENAELRTRVLALRAGADEDRAVARLRAQRKKEVA